MDIAKECDSENQRTMIVNTKCDSFSSSDNLKRLVHCLTSTSDSVFGEHAVACFNGDKEIESYREELQFLVDKLLKAPKERLGIGALIPRLQQVLLFYAFYDW